MEDSKNYRVRIGQQLVGLALLFISNTVQAQGYCVSSSDNSSRMHVDIVNVGALSNVASGNNGGYADFTTGYIFGTPDLRRESTTTIYLKAGSVDYSATPNWKVWIDFNHNGNFFDVGEQVVSIPITDYTLRNASISVPSSALLGNTRMRVSVGSWSPSPCDNLEYGETEDYLVNITDAAATISYCASRGLSAADWIDQVSLGNLNHTSVSSFGGYTDNTHLTASDLRQSENMTVHLKPGSTRTGSVTRHWGVWIDFNQDGDFSDVGESVVAASSTNLNILSATVPVPSSAILGTTRMRISLKYGGSPVVCEVFESGEVEDYAVTIVDASATVDYCISEGISSDFHYIDLVSASGLNHTSSSDGGYADNTNLTAPDLIRNESNAFSFSIGSANPSGIYTRYLNAWIDYNQDGDFSDIDEQVVSTSTVSLETLNSGVQIPASARLGSTRMRVSVKYSSSPSVCDIFQYGEVEDYTVNIMDSSCEAPTDLLIVSVTDHEAEISWNDPAGVGNYVILYSVSGRSVWLQAMVYGATTHTLTNLEGGTLYDVVVKRFCGVTSSSPSIQGNFETECPMIENLAATPSTTSIYLTWDGALGTQQYVVYYKKYGNTTWIPNSPTASTSLQISGLDPDSYYAIYVESVCASGSNWSSPDFYVLTNCAAPVNLTVTNIGTTSARINWQDNYGVGNYRVEYKKRNVSWWQQVTVNASGTTLLSALDYGSLYEVRVSRICTDNSSVPTSILQFQTVCPAPTNLMVTSVGYYEVNFTWTRPSPSPEWYDIQFRATGGSWWSSWATGNTFTALNLVPGTTYEAKIRSVCSGYSNFSNTVTFTVPNYCTSRGNSTQFEWISLVRLGSLNNQSVGSGGYANYTHLAAPDLTSGSSSSMRLSFGNSGSTSPQLVFWKVWIDLNRDGDFNDPSEQVASVNTSVSTFLCSIAIPSTASAGRTRMRVSMRYGSTPLVCQSFDWGEVEEYSINIVSGSPSARFNDEDISTTIETEQTLTVESEPGLYPNPVSDVLHISLPDSYRDSRLQIISITGEEIWKGEATDVINTSRWSSGTYILLIANNRFGVKSMKFVKQ